MKLLKLEDSKQAWNYIFIFNAGISLLSGTFCGIFFLSVDNRLAIWSDDMNHII